MATNEDIISKLSDIQIDQSQQKVQIESVLERVDEVKEDVKAINETINGNGEVGMKIELDRLKQSEKRRVWINRTLYTGLVSLVLYLIFGM